jgi:hypothetical protein
MISEWLISGGKTPPVCGPKGPRMTDQTNTPNTSAGDTYRPLQFDPAPYREYVQGMDLTVSQQDALLEAVWLIVVGVIDMGSGLSGTGWLDSKPLAADSSSVLGSISTSKRSNAEDAVADDGPHARRMDS